MKNIQTEGLIKELKKKSSEESVGIWRRIALDLEKPTRSRRIVNLFKINKFAKDKETVVVPGKVLGTGLLDKKVNVVAYSISDQAKEKLNKSGSSYMGLDELLQKNPKGKNVRILG
ncbi:MAG: 50S ribosomal protein L18e [Nanobdellota archaeon]